jgi:predicted lipoprotein with Yx(FWY)xxD motif
MGTRLTRRLLPLVVLLAVGVATALAATMSTGGTVKVAHNSKFGSILVSSSGLTLYHMTAEKRGAIKCTGACAKFWPPLLLGAGAKPKAGTGVSGAKLGTIKRPDGRLQVTYNGLALYRYSLDRKAGEVKGEGVEGIWFAVNPSGKIVKKATASVGATTTTGGGYR